MTHSIWQQLPLVFWTGLIPLNGLFFALIGVLFFKNITSSVTKDFAILLTLFAVPHVFLFWLPRHLLLISTTLALFSTLPILIWAGIATWKHFACKKCGLAKTLQIILFWIIALSSLFGGTSLYFSNGFFCYFVGSIMAMISLLILTAWGIKHSTTEGNPRLSQKNLKESLFLTLGAYVLMENYGLLLSLFS